MNPDSEAIFEYHHRSKHQFNAYAKGPEVLDWDDQPDPFRRFEAAPIVVLPQPGAELPCLFGDLDRPDKIAAQPLTLANLGLLLELSFGLSAWKQYGPDRWALRCNPSSGNLHPTEAYVLCTGDAVLHPGVYHYASYEHVLERRAEFAASTGPVGWYLGLSSIHWREAWKYGERAFRYCQHDIGHALAALSYAAGCLGWSVELCGEAADSDIAGWLGLNRSAEFVELEHEVPDLFCRLHTGHDSQDGFNAGKLSALACSAEWFGTARRLSGRHFYRWPLIDTVSAHAQKPETEAERARLPVWELPAPKINSPASQLIRQRRSAQRFNGKAQDLPQTSFYRMLAALLPNAKPPFTAWNWPAQVHLLLFVHRVEGLEPGLYCLPRDGQAVASLKQAMLPEFSWQPVDAPFDLYLLKAVDGKQIARTLSCHQPIASDSAFSLGMLACFAENIEDEPWNYRRLFWECGLLGQILYLESEAAGVRGTGIGCFFDDEVHDVLGLKDRRWQSLYHFTVGEPLDDARLQTLPAYGHLQR